MVGLIANPAVEGETFPADAFSDKGSETYSLNPA
jgi:hypothetical protein